jgi:hypothetical protein
VHPTLPARARKPEAFRLMAKADRVRVLGVDDGGAMYGLIELAKRIRYRTAAGERRLS